MDDDNYVNVRMLVKLLSSYPHTQDIYIGKPSLDRPIQATERISENKMVRWGQEVGAGSVWAGVCRRRSHCCCLPSLAAPCAFLVCHGRSGVLYQPGAGTEDEPMGQVRALVLLSHGDLSWSLQGTEPLWGWMLACVPLPCWGCLQGAWKQAEKDFGSSSN